ncbi:hypothetical protein LIER_30721 [Lithospermum erythrorhizon]|uniref:Uncharacterized protein n=1 Tax=Lithospermum erythrorhizon TaxID=34254 RepID=A0AAV3RSB4_LITER
MCIDFTSINKACPRDCYPLPNIDRLIDSSANNDDEYEALAHGLSLGKYFGGMIHIPIRASGTSEIHILIRASGTSRTGGRIHIRLGRKEIF